MICFSSWHHLFVFEKTKDSFSHSWHFSPSVTLDVCLWICCSSSLVSSFGGNEHLLMSSSSKVAQGVQNWFLSCTLLYLLLPLGFPCSFRKKDKVCQGCLLNNTYAALKHTWERKNRSFSSSIVYLAFTVKIYIRGCSSSKSFFPCLSNRVKPSIPFIVSLKCCVVFLLECLFLTRSHSWMPCVFFMPSSPFQTSFQSQFSFVFRHLFIPNSSATRAPFLYFVCLLIRVQNFDSRPRSVGFCSTTDFLFLNLLFGRTLIFDPWLTSRSLKGVWYLSRFCHERALTSLAIHSSRWFIDIPSVLR